MSSILHTGEGHKVTLPRGTGWLTVGVIAVALFIYYRLLKPLLWWAFEAPHLYLASGADLYYEGLYDPRRARQHVAVSGALFCLILVGLFFAYREWDVGYLIGAFIAAIFFAGLTQAHYTNERENEDYPRAGYLE